MKTIRSLVDVWLRSWDTRGDIRDDRISLSTMYTLARTVGGENRHICASPTRRGFNKKVFKAYLEELDLLMFRQRVLRGFVLVRTKFPAILHHASHVVPICIRRVSVHVTDRERNEDAPTRMPINLRTTLAPSRYLALPLERTDAQRGSSQDFDDCPHWEV